jgi:hypothetical protein
MYLCSLPVPDLLKWATDIRYHKWVQRPMRDVKLQRPHWKNMCISNWSTFFHFFLLVILWLTYLKAIEWLTNTKSSSWLDNAKNVFNFEDYSLQRSDTMWSAWRYQYFGGICYLRHYSNTPWKTVIFMVTAMRTTNLTRLISDVYLHLN